MFIPLSFAVFSLFHVTSCNECWTDRLREVPKEFSAPSCSLEDSLVEWANVDCGEQVQTYEFGERCKTGLGGPMHSDIRFTCCKPVEEQYPEPQIEELRNESERAFEMLKLYLNVFDNITASKERGDKGMVAYIVEHELVEFTKYLAEIRTDKGKQKQVHDSEKFFNKYKPGTVVTKQAFRHSLKEYLFHQATVRMTISFEVILSLIEKEHVLFSKEEKAQLRNDFRHTKFNYAWETATMSPRNDLFPELESEMHQYYIDILKLSTIGLSSNELTFFGDSDSTEKLIQLYEKVLKEERWTKQGIITSMGMFAIWLVTAVVFVGITSVCMWARNRKVMSFTAESDAEAYRSFAVRNWPLFAKPHDKIEECVEEDNLEEFMRHLEDARSEKGQLYQPSLYRYFAIACRFKSKKCFRTIVNEMVQYIDAHLWDKALIVSILIFYLYAEGLTILYSNEGVRELRILTIEETFESEGFLYTETSEHVKATKNTLLGVIAYGRLREGLADMAKAALYLGAEITKSGQFVRSPLLNAIQTSHYSVLSLFALKGQSAFSYKSPSNKTTSCDALTVAFECGDQDLLMWISGICQQGVVGHLPDKSPRRPTSSTTIRTTATEYMSLGNLLKGGFLTPGDLVEAKIERYFKMINHFMVYIGEVEGDDGLLHNDGIIHKDGTKDSLFSSSNNSDAPNGAVVLSRMTNCDYVEWRRAPLDEIQSTSGISPLLFLTCSPAYSILTLGLGMLNSALQTEDQSVAKPPLDVVFDAVERIGVCNYDLLAENCEHFVNEVKRGVSHSRQVKRVKEISGGISDLSGSLLGPSSGRLFRMS
ncbi:hypothetical protein QR680_011061 [Steinernema hermaphroditum]|uniref:LRAT domain-containing protein n=1 Tax=Steinernema hermaphroditum TaxID=289476 RepID=A0AA39ITR7_9BILA|nr:hypothetical protein QR680_011061 [Steinernema hermaphroditum]